MYVTMDTFEEIDSLTQTDIGDDIPDDIYDAVKKTAVPGSNHSIGIGVSLSGNSLFTVPSGKGIKTVVVRLRDTREIDSRMFARLHFERDELIGYQYFDIDTGITLDDVCSMNILDKECRGRLFDHFFGVGLFGAKTPHDVHRWLFVYLQAYGMEHLQENLDAMSDFEVVSLVEATLPRCGDLNGRIKPIYHFVSKEGMCRFLLKAIQGQIHPWSCKECPKK